MPTEHDYYEILGVRRDASDADIKKAFRGLARKLHPDVSEEADAEARFKEVVEAYEVLSKPESRQLYDRFGHSGLRSGGFQPSSFDFGSLSDLFSAFFGDDLLGAAGRTGRRARGEDVLAEVEIDLFAAAHGTKREVPVRIAAPCEACHGSGMQPDTQLKRCETCGGAGRLQQISRRAFGEVIRPQACPACGGAGRLQQISRSAFGEFIRTQACPACGGAGQIIEHPCTTCDGAGRQLEERTLEVAIPAGIHDGQQIRITGEGHAGSPGSRAGDVYVAVRIEPHAELVREGNDIFSTVELTMVQAALGATKRVATLEGETELEFAPGT